MLVTNHKETNKKVDLSSFLTYIESSQYNPKRYISNNKIQSVLSKCDEKRGNENEDEEDETKIRKIISKLSVKMDISYDKDEEGEGKGEKVKKRKLNRENKESLLNSLWKNDMNEKMRVLQLANLIKQKKSILEKKNIRYNKFTKLNMYLESKIRNEYGNVFYPSSKNQDIRTEKLKDSSEYMRKYDNQKEDLRTDIVKKESFCNMKYEYNIDDHVVFPSRTKYISNKNIEIIKPIQNQSRSQRTYSKSINSPKKLRKPHENLLSQNEKDYNKIIKSLNNDYSLYEKLLISKEINKNHDFPAISSYLSEKVNCYNKFFYSNKGKIIDFQKGKKAFIKEINKQRNKITNIRKELELCQNLNDQEIKLLKK